MTARQKLLRKMGRIILQKTQHQLKGKDWSRLNVLIKRYGLTEVATVINDLMPGVLKDPLAYMEKVAQANLMKNTKPGGSLILNLLKDKNE